MATSLEELLKEEGFKGKRLGASRLSTSQSQTVSMPLSPYQHKENSPSGSRIRSRMRTARSKSNIPQYIPRGESPGSDTVADRRPRDDFFRRNMLDAIPKSENRDTFERRDSNNLLEGEGLDINSLEDIQGHEIIEIGVVENGRRKDMYSDQIYNSYKSEKNSRGKEKYKESPGMELVVERILSSNLNKNLHISSSVNYSKSMKQTDNSYDSSFRRSQNRKSIKDNQGCKNGNLLMPASEPALDDAAIQAMISILSGHMKHFLKVEGFRSTLHHNCFSSLKVVASEECHNTENKVITNLEQAIETIERAAEGSASHKDIKKAFLQLTVITGLNSNDFKDGVTSGVLNSSLSACAHLYISVIYKLQKKDRASAKHLLQVFCDSPFGARTILLPELWDYLFFPHLSHLDAWYNQEAESLANSPRKSKRLKLLEKVFNEILDSGTYQYAIYYKDWLTEGVEVPSVPSIPIPSLSIEGFQPRDSLDNSLELASSTGPFSPQPMVSKKLYDAVFGRLRKPDTDEAEDEGRADYYDNCGRSSDGSVVEVKQALEYSSVTVTDQKIEEGSCSSAQDKGSFHNDALLLTYDDEEGRSYEVSVPPENDIHDDAKDPNISLETEGYSELLRSHPHEEVNGSTLKKLTKSVFELQETQDSHDLAVSVPSASPSAPAPDSSTQLTKTRPSFEELHGSYEYFDEDPFLLSIPPDFICALTGQLFQDPVTLETGQTFEKSAIRERFDHGNRTCPITGKTLECQSVPLTNFILKRVVDSWRSEQSNLLLTLASQIVRDSTEQRSTPKDDTAIFILEPLLTAFGRKEGVTNARQLISFGGLQFLICRFECGKLEEKTCVAALLSHCIEADASCRNQIAEKINKQLLLELLHCQQEKTRTNAVLLLSELICFSRRKDAKLYLSSLKSGELINTMHVLLEHLQRLKPEQRPLVAVLLLHIDLLGEPRKYSLYREGAIDAIRVALFNSLTDEKVRQKCCRSLLILGARFSSTGVLLTELWILKRAGIYGMCDDNWKENYRGDDLFVEDTLLLEDDEDLAEWLRDITISLLGTGKSLFLETMSYCLHSQELELAGVCLTTVAWMSCALSSHSEAALILSAFPALISGLKDVLENGQLYEHKVLASFSLLNFSKIPECKILLMKIAEEIAGSLRMVAEVSSAAKQLHAIICGEQRSVI